MERNTYDPKEKPGKYSELGTTYIVPVSRMKEVVKFAYAPWDGMENPSVEEYIQHNPDWPSENDNKELDFVVLTVADRSEWDAQNAKRFAKKPHDMGRKDTAESARNKFQPKEDDAPARQDPARIAPQGNLKAEPASQAKSESPTAAKVDLTPKVNDTSKTKTSTYSVKNR